MPLLNILTIDLRIGEKKATNLKSQIAHWVRDNILRRWSLMSRVRHPWYAAAAGYPTQCPGPPSFIRRVRLTIFFIFSSNRRKKFIS